jgi:hypothetical protein
MKGQDVLVMLKLLCKEPPWSYLGLAKELGMSASEVHSAVKRCQEAGLYNPHTHQPNRVALREFVVHGLRYVFPASPGPLVQGLPTSFASPPMRKMFRFDKTEAPVMPLPGGPARGPGIAPLYRSAPLAASSDERLYHLLALVDALRTGRARERKLATEALVELVS